MARDNILWGLELGVIFRFRDGLAKTGEWCAGWGIECNIGVVGVGVIASAVLGATQSYTRGLVEC